MNKQKHLWDNLAKKNSRYYINSDFGRGITETQFRKSGSKDVKKYITDDPLIELFDVAVEIGCGTGRMTEFLTDYFSKIYAVDVSKEMIEQARERLVDYDNIELIESDGYTLPVESNVADLVFSYLVFQHIKDKGVVESNFKEAFRVLKQGGLFKVRIRTDELQGLDDWWAGVWYSEKEARELAEKTGFKVVKTEPVGKYGLWLWLIKQ